jgi:uncharacterized protein YabE (DUF348 family)
LGRKVSDILKLFKGLALKLNRRSVLLAVFVLVTFFVALAANLSGFSFFGPTKTRIVINYGDEKLDFFSTKKNLSDALLEKGITIFPQDKTELALDTALNGKAVKGAIDRSLPVTIFDGYTKISGRSTSTDSVQILADNSVKVYPEDKVSSDLVLDPVSVNAVGVMVKIDRAPVYYVAIDDKSVEVRSWNPQVLNILTLSKQSINPQDEVSPSKDTNLVPGDTIVVTRINEVDIPVTSEIAYKTQNTTSSAVAFGQSKVTQSGTNGQISKVYHVVYKNGVEVSRWLKSSSVTRPVQHKIVFRGSMSGKSNWGPYYEDNKGPYTTSFHYPGYVGRYLLITNNATKKQVKVKIVDIGPDAALLDLSTTAFEEIGGSVFHGHIDSVTVSLID